ncbi:MAG: T9SS type A sorting domain-containing protein, partial [Bacteroidetes bacterium]|nr:T9SS type A sorting domain-containing protein [Bacteroidota bacterium]
NGTNVGTGATYTSTTLATGNIVTCVMTTTVACPSTPTATSNSVTMTVNPTVTPAISISASATTICPGTAVTFTPTPTNGGTPAYQWKVNGTNVGTGATYTSTTLATGNIVTCVMTSTVTCPSTPTATSNAITMIVNPTVTPSVSISASATSICNGTSVTFTPSPTNGGTPIYQWKLNGANIATGATYTSSTLNNGDLVTCIMTSTASCLTSSTATSNAITISVSGSVAPSVAIAASATSICSGTSVLFTPTPTNGGTPTYQWKLNGTNIATGATYTNSSLNNGDIVTCIMTSSLTCATTPTATSNSVSITVNSTVTPLVSISTSATSICSGTNVIFTPNPTNGGTPTYQWLLNGVNSGTGTTYSSSSLSNNDVISCIMTSNESCISSSTATSNNVTMVVNSTVTPLVSISASSTSICNGTPVVYNAIPTNGGTPTYEWFLNGSSVGTGNTYTNPTVANNDIISCIMTTSLACSTSPTVNSNSVTMTVHPTPATPVITQTGFTLNSDNPNGNQWYFANLGAPIGGGTNQTYTPIVSGSYYVIVTDQFGCVSDTSNTIIIVITGIENINETSFSIFPNPTNGNFIVQLNSNNEKAKIELFDAIGQIVFKKELINSNKIECNLNNLANGVYSIRITTSNSSSTQKIVIQK